MTQSHNNFLLSRIFSTIVYVNNTWLDMLINFNRFTSKRSTYEWLYLLQISITIYRQ